MARSVRLDPNMSALFSLIVCARLWSRDAVTIVALHTPAVGRVGLTNIDHQERGPVFVGPVQFLDVARMAAEWSAREAAEDQDDGLGPDHL